MPFIGGWHPEKYPVKLEPNLKESDWFYHQYIRAAAKDDRIAFETIVFEKKRVSSGLYNNHVTILATLIIPISEIILILRFLKIILNVTT